MANDPKHQYDSGVSAIRAALMEEVVRQTIPKPFVTSRQGSISSHVPSRIFSVQANDKTEEMTFTFDDIKDSANGTVPEHVLVKVRDLVSRLISPI